MIDSIDLQIIDRLQADARTSNADLARHLGMAASAVHQRVRKLEDRGVVQGYLARVDPRVVERGLLAFIHLRTEERLDETHVADAVAEIPGVLEVHDIAGEDCYLVKVRVADTDALHHLIRGRIAAVRGVLGTKTTIVLKTFAERYDLPLPHPTPDN